MSVGLRRFSIISIRETFQNTSITTVVTSDILQTTLFDHKCLLCSEHLFKESDLPSFAFRVSVSFPSRLTKTVFEKHLFKVLEVLSSTRCGGKFKVRSCSNRIEKRVHGYLFLAHVISSLSSCLYKNYFPLQKCSVQFLV